MLLSFAEGGNLSGLARPSTRASRLTVSLHVHERIDRKGCLAGVRKRNVLDRALRLRDEAVEEPPFEFAFPNLR